MLRVSDLFGLMKELIWMDENNSNLCFSMSGRMRPYSSIDKVFKVDEGTDKRLKWLDMLCILQ